MALAERLLGQEEPAISAHDFFAALGEIMRGALTVAQVKTALEMDAAAQTQFDQFIAAAPTGTTAAAMRRKGWFIDLVHGVVLLGRRGYPGYNTPAQLAQHVQDVGAWVSANIS